MNLRQHKIYDLVHQHLRERWREELTLVPDTAPLANGVEYFVGKIVPTCAVIAVNGLRYGAASFPQGRRNRYAFVNGRIPVEIQLFLRITHNRHDARLQPLKADIAVVRPFLALQNEPSMPWDLRYVLMGASVTQF